jgi:hypothetical protein
VDLLWSKIMRMFVGHLSVFVLLLLLAGCDGTPKPDYTIHVVPSEQGMVAVPPTCPSWVTDIQDPFDHQPYPQFGCSTAQDLAMMVERPEDLVAGRNLGDTRGVPMVGAIRRYDNNQTRGLIWTSSDPNQTATTTAPTASSSLTGDVTGASSSSASSSSSGP